MADVDVTISSTAVAMPIPLEARHVPFARDHRVVRREPHRHPGGVQRRDELTRAVDRLETAIDDAVEVEDDEADALGKAAHAAG